MDANEPSSTGGFDDHVSQATWGHPAPHLCAAGCQMDSPIIRSILAPPDDLGLGFHAASNIQGPLDQRNPQLTISAAASFPSANGRKGAAKCDFISSAKNGPRLHYPLAR